MHGHRVTATQRTRSLQRRMTPLLQFDVVGGAYRRRTLPGADASGHSAAVHCFWLWTYPAGLDSRLCVSSDFAKSGNGEEALASEPSRAGFLVSGGSYRRVVVWDLGKDRLVKVLQDHLDSVLCVRVDSGRLVTCSKDQTVRTYGFPSLKPQFVFRAHRAAINVVGDVIVSGSGDRSIRVWNANTANIASIEFKPPYLLSGSSDMHLRMFDIASSQGWSTNPEVNTIPSATVPSLTSSTSHVQDDIAMIPGHTTVALGEEFAVSGSYDLTIKLKAHLAEDLYLGFLTWN
ncbi:WD40-repeat-containing domain protein [Suillus discolor]|uniref:WD40-repeat-containing domain protein n=1 Tax=Suillus discolor TaxID=1912936 RepID=A0A9P7JZN6_9AGAM|nr:WD40-repeat-containing domain protein [Suillus discolor]KAG2118129.1 WD40-repeat-containing domain protein [Suillus discolor]